MSGLPNNSLVRPPCKIIWRVSNDQNWSEVFIRQQWNEGLYMTFILWGPVVLEKSFWYFIPTMFAVSLKNTFTPSVCQTVLENNCSGLNLSASWVEFAKTLHTPEPESICHPNQILCCHGRRGSAQRGCIQYENESSSKAVITEKCQIFRPAADSSAQLAAVEARPTQSKVHNNNRGHCGFSLIRRAFQLEPSTSEF